MATPHCTGLSLLFDGTPLSIWKCLLVFTQHFLTHNIIWHIIKDNIIRAWHACTRKAHEILWQQYVFSLVSIKMACLKSKLEEGNLVWQNLFYTEMSKLAKLCSWESKEKVKVCQLDDSFKTTSPIGSVSKWREKHRSQGAWVRLLAGGLWKGMPSLYTLKEGRKCIFRKCIFWKYIFRTCIFRKCIFQKFFLSFASLFYK